MKLRPLKRVGEGATFKGLRGVYLTSFMFYAMGALLVLLIAINLPFGAITKFLLLIISTSLLLYKYKELKDSSKGDIHQDLKKNCRKNILIKSSRFNVRKKT